MKLIWFIYNRQTRRMRRRPILGIFLGQTYSKIHILESKSLAESAALLIRANIKKLKLMNPNERMIWLRDRVPKEFSKSYKTIFEDNVEILKEYEIAPIGSDDNS